MNEDSGWRDVGTFNSLTRPTDEQVALPIQAATDDMMGRVTAIDPKVPRAPLTTRPGSDYERRVRGVIALYAAILIELYFPEQVRLGQSASSVYQQLV